MRIFVSYASEHRSTAERIAIALRDAGHEVFFDKDDLPPGKTYDERIRKSILRCNLFVFLVSPESVQTGRYTLSELKIARSKWPSPQRFVLPVMTGGVELDQVPAYLRSVTILTPEGNLIIEVVQAVEQLRGAQRLRRAINWSVAAVVGAIAIFAAVYLSVRLASPAPKALADIQQSVEHGAKAADESNAHLKDISKDSREIATTTGHIEQKITTAASAAELALAQQQLNEALTARDLTNRGQVPALEKLLAAGQSYQGADFDGVNLSQVNLAGRDFTKTSFRGANLSQATLDKTNLQDCRFRLATLNRATVKDADFAGAGVPFGTAEHTVFDGADCTQSDFFGGRLQGASFRNAKLRGADFTFCDLRNVDFTGSELEDAIFIGSVLDNANFKDARFSNTDFTGAAADKTLLSAAQKRGIGRSVVARQGAINWNVLMYEHIPSSKYEGGIHYSRYLDTQTYLPGFGDTSLPLCKPAKTANGDSVVTPFEISLEVNSRSDFDTAFLSIARRRGDFADRLKEQMKFIQSNLSADRVLHGDASQSSEWSATLREQAQRCKFTMPMYASSDHLLVLLLAAGAVSPDRVRWKAMADFRFRLERTKARGVPVDARLEQPYDPWEPLFPEDIPISELPNNYADIYRAWTEKRAMVVDKTRLTLVETTWLDPKQAKSDLFLIRQGAWNVPSDVAKRLGIEADHTIEAPLRQDMAGVQSLRFVFPNHWRSYSLDVPADKLSKNHRQYVAEIDFAIEKIEQGGDKRQADVFIVVRPLGARLVMDSKVIWNGDVAVAEPAKRPASQ